MLQDHILCFGGLKKKLDNPCLNIAGINFFMDVGDTTMMKNRMNFSLMELEPSERTRYECHDWRVNLYSTVEIPYKPNFYLCVIVYCMTVNKEMYHDNWATTVVLRNYNSFKLGAVTMFKDGDCKGLSASFFVDELEKQKFWNKADMEANSM